MNENTYTVNMTDDEDSIVGSSSSQYNWSTGSIDLSGVSTSITGINSAYAYSESQKALVVQGDTKISGRLQVGDVDLLESLERIERMVGTLRLRPDLEQQCRELRELGELYRAKQQELEEQLKILEILKS